MNFRKTTLYFSAFIFFIIIFDAFQQFYYLTSFNILGEGVEVSISELIISHFFRWIIWAVSALPIAWFSWNKFSANRSSTDSAIWIKIILSTLLSWTFAIAFLAILNIYTSDGLFTASNFYQNYLFFIVQKGITFFFAYSVLILTLFNNAKNIVIEAQWLEISTLKESPESNGEQVLDPQVSIKIGNKIKLIPLSEVTWIESDDYCVKIHTERRSYSLRKSLKSLEEQLAPYQFIRVHRGALLNLGYLDQVDFEQSVIKLQDASELPLSKSGAQVLRKALKASSI